MRLTILKFMLSYKKQMSMTKKFHTDLRPTIAPRGKDNEFEISSIEVKQPFNVHFSYMLGILSAKRLFECIELLELYS